MFISQMKHLPFAEANKTEYTALSQETFRKTLPMAATPDDPLGLVVNRYWQRAPEAYGTDVLFPEARMRWKFMCLTQKFDKAGFWRRHLSLRQYNSLRILIEWWDCTTQPPHVMAPAKDLICSGRGIIPSRSEENIVGDKRANVQHTRYQQQLYILFFYEFWPEKFISPRHTENLWLFKGLLCQVRGWAMDLAALQRVAYAVVKAGLPASPSPSIPSSPTAQIQAAADLPGLLARSIGATLDPCHWLEKDFPQLELPFYLWNVEARCTVEAAELKDRGNVQYICISHTWGRFRIREQFAKIPGVSWAVPCNTQFSVRSLPDQLTRVFQKGFIWIDLLCIPQDRTPLALGEIARQSLIFVRATSVVAWINDLFEWKDLQAAIEWVSLFYLYSRANIDFCYPQNQPSTPQAHWGLRRDSFTSATSSRSTLQPLLSGNVTPWLTSLWTLQEACLRPDMSFCNAKWEPLLIGENTLMTLDTIIVLASFLDVANREGTPVNLDQYDMSYCSGYWHDPVRPNYTGRNAVTISALLRYRKGDIAYVNSLKSALESSRVWKVNQVLPANLLSLGQLRQVTDSGPTARAEAIMSAVGATSWFKEFYSPNNSQPSDLVMGLYPLPFLRELARKQPVSFYWTSTDCLEYLTSSVSLSPYPWVRAVGRQYCGSMMPFLADKSHVSGEGSIGGFSLLQFPEDCVLDWLIQVDGSVLIRKALCFKRLKLQPSMHSDFRVAPLVENDGILSHRTPMLRHREPFLDEWLETFHPATPNYAVSLSRLGESNRGNFGLCGILLKRVGFQNDTEVLVKIGIFLAPNDGSYIFERKKVNWLVI